MTLNIHGIKSTFPTPAYSHVGRGEFTDVYDPAEDTFLLIDALEMEADSLKARVDICLEIGCGSGVISAFVASIIGPRAWYLCTDINPSAAACALETAQINRLRIDPVITDLGQLSLLDVVRALKIYLEKSVILCKTYNFLFVLILLNFVILKLKKCW